MSDSDRWVIVVLRQQAWTRAKCALEEVANTFVGDDHPSTSQPGQFERYMLAFTRFIKEIEDEGLAE